MKLIICNDVCFISSNFISCEFATSSDEFIYLNKLMYTGNLNSLECAMKQLNFGFVKGDIADSDICLD